MSSQEESEVINLPIPEKELARIAYRLILAVDPTAAEMNTSQQWNLLEDLYCMTQGKLMLPTRYPPLNRSLGAWKARKKIATSTVRTNHLDELQDMIYNGARISRTRAVYSQDRYWSLGSEAASLQNERNNSSRHQQKTELAQLVKKNQSQSRRVKLPTFDVASPKYCSMKLLKYAAMFEYLPNSDSSFISAYDFILAYALHHRLSIKYIVDEPVIPEALTDMNFDNELSLKQAWQLLNFLMTQYPEVHPSNIDYTSDKPANSS